MKVFNLTDVPTDVLTQRGLVGQGIATSGRIVNPGEYIDVEDTAKSRSDLEYLLTVGAVSIDALPPPYVVLRQQLQVAANQVPRLRQHVQVDETKVAGDALPGPSAEGETVMLEKHDATAQESDPPPAPPTPEDPPPMQPPMARGKKASR